MSAGGYTDVLHWVQAGLTLGYQRRGEHHFLAVVALPRFVRSEQTKLNSVLLAARGKVEAAVDQMIRSEQSPN